MGVYLSPAQVDEILAAKRLRDTLNNKALARRYGTDVYQIEHVIKRGRPGAVRGSLDAEGYVFGTRLTVIAGRYRGREMTFVRSGGREQVVLDDGERLHWIKRTNVRPD